MACPAEAGLQQQRFDGDTFVLSKTSVFITLPCHRIPRMERRASCNVDVTFQAVSSATCIRSRFYNHRGVMRGRQLCILSVWCPREHCDGSAACCADVLAIYQTTKNPTACFCEGQITHTLSLSVCLFVSVSVCLSVCLFLSLSLSLSLPSLHPPPLSDSQTRRGGKRKYIFSFKL